MRKIRTKSLTRTEQQKSNNLTTTASMQSKALLFTTVKTRARQRKKAKE